ncbi:MAG: hypothetical protein IJG97_02025 [Bacilli bacterium]|nr:hypothetical protein [Bacilli bacterium]
MRLKEFIIFIAIFTVVYIIFFIIFDRLKSKKEEKERQEYAMSLIKIEQYVKFASFYGIQATATLEVVLRVYNDFYSGKDCIISKQAKVYNLSNLEFVVIVLYLEYLNLMNKKIISLEKDSMKKITFVEHNMIQKYMAYFQAKRDLNFISTNGGSNALSDLTTMNKFFLMPGIRLIDSKLYYVGDYL